MKLNENRNSSNYKDSSYKDDILSNSKGKIIDIDINANTINVRLSDEEFAKRRAEWKPREPKINTGYLARYASLVTSADKGAVLKVK